MRRTIDVSNNTIVQGRNTIAIPQSDTSAALQVIAQRLPPDSIDFINIAGDAVSGRDVDLPHLFGTDVRFWIVDMLPSTQMSTYPATVTIWYPLAERRISAGRDLSDKNTLKLKVFYDGTLAIRVEPVQ